MSDDRDDEVKQTKTEAETASSDSSYVVPDDVLIPVHQNIPTSTPHTSSTRSPDPAPNEVLIPLHQNLPASFKSASTKPSSTSTNSSYTYAPMPSDQPKALPLH